MFALLALHGWGKLQPERDCNPGLDWLAKTQRPDGGWSPHPGVDQSTWMTSLVLLLPGPMAGRLNWKAAADWLIHTTGRESSLLQRVRSVMITGKIPNPGSDGWPFYPNTAAWVSPTAFSILALRKMATRYPERAGEIRQRIDDGELYLAARRCADGGWNHGSSRALGYDSPSYPETTGLALASLKGAPPDLLRSSIAAAESHWRSCRSLEATRWLELGLLAQNRRVAGEPKPYQATRTLLTQELAIDVITTSALQGRNPLEPNV